MGCHGRGQFASHPPDHPPHPATPPAAPEHEQPERDHRRRESCRQNSTLQPGPAYDGQNARPPATTCDRQAEPRPAARTCLPRLRLAPCSQDPRPAVSTPVLQPTRVRRATFAPSSYDLRPTASSPVLQPEHGSRATTRALGQRRHRGSAHAPTTTCDRLSELPSCSRERPTVRTCVLLQSGPASCSQDLPLRTGLARGLIEGGRRARTQPCSSDSDWCISTVLDTLGHSMLGSATLAPSPAISAPLSATGRALSHESRPSPSATDWAEHRISWARRVSRTCRCTEFTAPAPSAESASQRVSESVRARTSVSTPCPPHEA